MHKSVISLKDKYCHFLPLFISNSSFLYFFSGHKNFFSLKQTRRLSEKVIFKHSDEIRSSDIDWAALCQFSCNEVCREGWKRERWRTEGTHRRKRRSADSNEGRKKWVRGQNREIRVMQQQISLSRRSDCSMMEGQIGEEAEGSAHRSSGDGIIPPAITPDCFGAKRAAVHECWACTLKHTLTRVQSDGNTSVM